MTDTNNVPAVVLPQIHLPVETKDLSKLQRGWLRLAALREEVFNSLQKDELAIQSKLNQIPKETELSAVQTLLGEAKEMQAEMKGKRLHFTNYVSESIIDKAMEFEKRTQALFPAAVEFELNLRKAVVEKQTANNAKQTEVNALKAHIESEHFRIAAAYRLELYNFVMNAYKDCLSQKIKPGKALQSYLEKVRGFMKAQKLSAFIQYERKLVSLDEAKVIYNQVKKYLPKEDLDKALEELDERFSNYKNDLENASKAIKAASKEQAEQVADINEEVNISKATSELIAQAGTFEMTGGPTIKKRKEVVEENTDEWAINVIENFFRNWNACRKYLRVSTWAKLSIGQMAASLGKLVTDDKEIKLSKLQIKEVEK